MGSEGILRRAVPQWFATAAFRGLVSGYEDASRGHGGSGALYVRLRRNQGSRGMTPFGAPFARDAPRTRCEPEGNGRGDRR